jgi:hypothetical protein
LEIVDRRASDVNIIPFIDRGASHNSGKLNEEQMRFERHEGLTLIFKLHIILLANPPLNPIGENL